MPKLIDLTGQTFGRLTVLEIDKNIYKGTKKWICKCTCGTIKSVQGSNLRNGLTQSCGCLQREKTTHSFIGQRFGKLVVLKDSGKRKSNRGIIWTCKCDCGNICDVAGTSLQQKDTFSCGCLKQSHGEMVIELLLQEKGIPYKKEYVFKDLKTPKGGYARFDFAIFNDNNSISHLIEYDGETHDPTQTHGWNTEEKVQYQLLCDTIKTEYCKQHNIPLIRIPYTKTNITIEDLLLF